MNANALTPLTPWYLICTASVYNYTPVDSLPQQLSINDTSFVCLAITQ